MNTTWWKEAVIYQIYPKSFMDSNNDGIGDLKGITLKLNYLKELGVEGIWLSPFFKSPMRDNGYDVADYCEIDPMFGSMADMEALINEAQKMNLKLIVDLVFNHTSSEHPWFKAALEDRNSPYRNYYIFKESPNGQPPNNWRSIFGGSVWEEVEPGVYYMHTFDKSQPDLNWENEELRHELYRVVNFWIDKGISGFRIDAITFIKKHPSFASLSSDSKDGLVDVGRMTLNQEGIHDFLQELKTHTYGKNELVTIAEAPGVPYKALRHYISPKEGAFSMVFDFSYTDMDLGTNGAWYPKREWDMQEFKEKLFHSQIQVQKVGWGALFLESHDQPRIIDKIFGTSQSISDDSNFLKGSVLATLYFFLRGTPFIYQGQEIGMRNIPFHSIDAYDDIATKDQYDRARFLGATDQEALTIANQRSRDHSRTPMQWSDRNNGGFCEVQSWLPVHPNYKDVNVDNQKCNQNSLYAYYKRLIQIRKSEAFKDIFVEGRFEPIITNASELIFYQRISTTGDSLIVLINLSNKIKSIEIELQYDSVILSNYDIPSNQEIRLLNPYEAVVMFRSK